METPEELNFLTALLPLAGIIFIIALGVVLLNQHFHKNLYRQRLEREELKNLHQQELLRSSIAVQEEERKRIAHDLHDELGAVLSIARMHLVQLERQSANGAESMLPPLQNVRSLTEAALASMRRISHKLMPPQLETFGLIKTLEDVAAQANSTNGIEIRVSTPADIPRLSWPLELGLYRICMELINNTLKHAQASHITVHLKLEHGLLTLLYTDNGTGIPDNRYTGGMGHKSIEARVSALMGVLALSEEETEGFCVSIKIPVNESARTTGGVSQ
jgi:signal transduction histidine kinase